MKSLRFAIACEGPAAVAPSPVPELEGGLRLLARLIARQILESRKCCAMPKASAPLGAARVACQPPEAGQATRGGARSATPGLVCSHIPPLSDQSQESIQFPTNRLPDSKAVGNWIVGQSSGAEQRNCCSASRLPVNPRSVITGVGSEIPGGPYAL